MMNQALTLTAKCQGPRHNPGAPPAQNVALDNLAALWLSWCHFYAYGNLAMQNPYMFTQHVAWLLDTPYAKARRLMHSTTCPLPVMPHPTNGRRVAVVQGLVLLGAMTQEESDRWTNGPLVGRGDRPCAAQMRGWPLLQPPRTVAQRLGVVEQAAERALARLGVLPALPRSATAGAFFRRDAVEALLSDIHGSEPSGQCSGTADAFWRYVHGKGIDCDALVVANPASTDPADVEPLTAQQEWERAQKLARQREYQRRYRERTRAKNRQAAARPMDEITVDSLV